MDFCTRLDSAEYQMSNVPIYISQYSREYVRIYGRGSPSLVHANSVFITGHNVHISFVNNVNEVSL